MKRKMKNKKGWVKILEAFLAILLIVAVLSIIIVKDLTKKNEFSEGIHALEISILEKIQLNETARTEIVNSIPSLELGDDDFPESVKKIIEEKIPEGLNCSIKICFPGEECVLSEIPSRKEIYVKSSIISSYLEKYSPKLVTIFCWRGNEDQWDGKDLEY